MKLKSLYESYTSALPGSEILIEIPSLRQSTPYSCGATVLQAIFAYYKLNKREDQIIKELPTNKDGAELNDLIKASNRFGIHARRRDDLTKEKVIASLKKKNPVILLVKPKNKQDEHFLIVVGKYNSGLIFRDTSRYTYAYIPFNDLLTRWHKSQTGYLGIEFVNNTLSTFNNKEVVKV